MASEEARRVIEAIDDLDLIEDPKARALAAGEVLARIPQKNKHLRELRQAAVLEMLAQPDASLRKVGEELGLNYSTVQDIAKGHTASGRNRARKGDAPSEES